MGIKELCKDYEKGLIVLVCIILWIVVYFATNMASKGRATHSLPQVISSLPFAPEFVLVYFSCFFLVLMPYFFVKGKENFRKVAYSYIAVVLISAAVYLLYPIEVMREKIISQGIFHKMVAWLYAIDYPYNSFPSLHVGLSVLAALSCYKFNKKASLIFGFWAVLIAVSTLFIRQHYFLDIIGGALLAVVVFWFYQKRC